MPPASRSLDAEALAGLQLAYRLGRELLAVEQVAPGRAVLASVRPGRSVAAAFGDQRVAERGECFELADHAVAAVMLAGSARVAAHRVLDHAHRELELERLDRRVERVAHRHVNAA